MTIPCPLDDCGWAFDAAPSPLGADAPDAVRKLAHNCHDMAIGYELRRHFASHDPRDILRTIGRLVAEHAKFAEAIAEMAVELRDSTAPGEDIVATVLRIRDERDNLHEIVHGAPDTMQTQRENVELRAENERLRESRFAWAAEAGRDTTQRPEAVVLCGSMRFWPLMLRVADVETQAGRIVLAPFVAVEPDQQDSAAKKMLDELHRAKIRMADRVIVVSDETGYYGDSTRGEIEYALSLGLPVSFQTVESEVET